MRHRPAHQLGAALGVAPAAAATLADHDAPALAVVLAAAQAELGAAADLAALAANREVAHGEPAIISASLLQPRRTESERLPRLDKMLIRVDEIGHAYRDVRLVHRRP